ncbi:MAG: MHYT domain-containing protein [Gemmatimonas sp.]
MHGTYDFFLVALSIVIAILASYTALTLAGRVTAARDRVRRAWLLGGSVAMGTGVWSMHFVAMLAFRLPIQVGYDVPLVALSLLAAMAASALAMVIASRPTLNHAQLATAACVMGGGIVTMHYTGMEALRMQAHLTYDPWLVALSVVIAITASAVALWTFRRLREDESRRGAVLKMAAAVVLGFAITGLHYTAMTASHFTPSSDTALLPHGFLLATNELAAAVIMGTLLILVLALGGALVDHWVRVKLAGTEALRESEERYRTVMNDVHEVFFRVDATAHWTFLNPAWTEITGFTIEESIGASIFTHIHPDFREGVADLFTYFADGGDDTSRHDVRFLKRNGGTCWVEVHARVTRDKLTGAFIGTAGSLRDITAHREAEEALRAARETAEAASRAKSEFLSRMSHELRTPLNAILGFGQLLEIEDLTPDNHESVQHILKGGRHLLDLINEVLDMAGIEAGRLRLSSEAVSVSEVGSEVLDLLRPLAAKREITLVAGSVQSCESFVLADRQRLKQVLLNLISNAIKYNHVGGSVTVETKRMDTERMRIFVRDTGDGIPASRIDRLFTPFDRLGAEQSGIEGTGLGLALSKSIAEAMNGSIGVESTARPGEGTTFWIELPLAEDPLEIFQGIETSSQRTAEFSVSACKTRVLYVEDNLANLELVQRIILRRPDVELIPCLQGELGLEFARAHAPHLILLDLHLPDMPGEEVLTRLKASPGTRDIPVIVVSADATTGLTERLNALGAHGYLTKPINVRMFLTAIDEVLSHTMVNQ